MPITTTSQVPPEVRTYFDRLLLTLARPYYIYDMFGQKRTIPLNSGNQMVFRRYSTFSAATVPITDGTTPPGDSLSITDFSTQIMWYGNFVVITDQVQFTVQDRVLNEATRVLSLQLGLTIDTLIRNMMVATASSILCSNGVNGNTPSEITTADIKTAVRALRLGNARLMTKPIPGENRFATSPVRSSFWGFMDVTIQNDLEACADFLSCANYPNPMDALEAELNPALGKSSLIDLDLLAA
jgi:N4-gp56 family major capsid protein